MSKIRCIVVGLAISTLFLGWCEAVKIGDSCKDNANICSSIRFSACYQQHCVCHNGYVASTDLTTCLEKRFSLGESCQDSKQCQVDNSVCYGLLLPTCTCTSSYVPSSNKKECLPVRNKLDEKCESTKQCLVANSECTRGICDCDDGSFPKDTITCLEFRDKLDEQCVDNLQCLVPEEATCANNKCSCPSGYNSSSNKEFCVTPAGLAEKCHDSGQCPESSSCKSFEGETDKQCLCDTIYQPDGGQCRRAGYAHASSHKVQLGLLAANIFIAMKMYR